MMTRDDSRRADTRRKTILGGRLYDDRGNVWDCIVKDLSESGAKVVIETDLGLGEFVDFKVNKFEDIRRAEVRWIEGNLMGIRFLAKMEKVPSSMRRLFTLMKEHKR